MRLPGYVDILKKVKNVSRNRILLTLSTTFRNLYRITFVASGLELISQSLMCKNFIYSELSHSSRVSDEIKD